MAQKSSKQLRDEAYNQLIKATHEKALGAMRETAGQYNYATEQAKQAAAITNAAQQAATNAVIQQTRSQLQGIGSTYAPGQGGGVVNPAIANAQRQAINVGSAELAYQAGEAAAPTQAPTPFAGIGMEITQGGVPLSTGMGQQAMYKATGDLYEQALQGARTSQMGEIAMREWQAEQAAAANRAAQEAEIAYKNEQLRQQQAFEAKQNALTRAANLREAQIRYGESSGQLSPAQQQALMNAYYTNGLKSKLGYAIAVGKNKYPSGVVNFEVIDPKTQKSLTKNVNIGNLEYSLLATIGQAASAQDSASKMYTLQMGINSLDEDSRRALAMILFNENNPALISPTNLLPYVDQYVEPTTTNTTTGNFPILPVTTPKKPTKPAKQKRNPNISGSGVLGVLDFGA